MSLLMWTLIISGILILGLITYKNFENSKGGVIFAPVLRKRADDFIDYSAAVLSGAGNKVSRQTMKKLSGIPHHLNVILHRVWKRVSKKVDGYFERLRGHHHIVKKD